MGRLKDVKPKKKDEVKASPNRSLPKGPHKHKLKSNGHDGTIEEEILALQRDNGLRHARQLTTKLQEYNEIVESLEKRNQLLQEELSFDSYISRDDPHSNAIEAEKLSNLYVQGNNFIVRLELERKEINRLNQLIQLYESKVAEQQIEQATVSSMEETHKLLYHRFRKIERDLDRGIIQLNTKLRANKALRDSIDYHRDERAQMDIVYTKIATEMFTTRQKLGHVESVVENMRQEVMKLETQMEEIQLENEQWETSCDQEAADIMSNIQIELSKKQHKDVQETDESSVASKDSSDEQWSGQKIYIGETNIMKHLDVSQDARFQSNLKHIYKSSNRDLCSDNLIEKFEESRSCLEKIYDVSGAKSIPEVIEVFQAQELEHFQMIRLVNQMADEIEKYRGKCSKLREKIGAEKMKHDSLHLKSKNRTEELNSSLQQILKQKNKKELVNQQLHAFLEEIKPSIVSFHVQLGGSELHGDDDLCTTLGHVEMAVLSILQRYYLHNQLKFDGLSARPINLLPMSDSLYKSDHIITEENNISTQKGKDNTYEKPVLLRQRTGTFQVSRIPLDGTSPDGIHRVPSKIHTNFLSSGVSVGGNEPEDSRVTIANRLSKVQPFRYHEIQRPNLSVEEFHKNDNKEEEYPLTYDELQYEVKTFPDMNLS